MALLAGQGVEAQGRRDKRAALRLLRKLLKKQGMAPEELVTDRLRAYRAAARELGLSAEHIQGKRKNDRAETSHVPIGRRERKPSDVPSERVRP